MKSDSNIHGEPLHTVTTTDDGADTQWYVMRSGIKKSTTGDGKRLYGWERAALLARETFIPMRETITTVRGKRLRKEVPAANDLIFVRDTPEHAQEMVNADIGLTFRYIKGAPYRQPLTVRDADMQRFIATVDSAKSKAFYTADELGTLHIGQRVMLTDGPLAGTEGHILTIRGSRKRRLLIGIEGLLYAAVEVLYDPSDPTRLRLLTP